MKLIVTMLSLVLFGVWVTARSGSIIANPPLPNNPDPAGWPKIKIHFDHGDWDEEKQQCVEGKGLCKISIDIIFNVVKPGEGSGDLWYDGEHLHFVAQAETYAPRTYQSIFQGASYTLSSPFDLPDNVCDALGIRHGYQILPGTYPIKNAGSEYSNADREIVF